MICRLRISVEEVAVWGVGFQGSGCRRTGWGPLVISRVIRALNWVIRTLS